MERAPVANSRDMDEQMRVTAGPPPSVGRIVHYRLTEQDVGIINKARGAGGGNSLPSGNPVAIGETVPMVIVQVWGNGESVNGQALLDGNDSLWVTSSQRGTMPGTWQWPKRVG